MIGHHVEIASLVEAEAVKASAVVVADKELRTIAGAVDGAVGHREVLGTASLERDKGLVLYLNRGEAENAVVNREVDNAVLHVIVIEDGVFKPADAHSLNLNRANAVVVVDNLHRRCTRH